MSQDIKLSLIDRDSTQPRKHFDDAGIEELAQSMAQNGLAVPILLRPAGERFIIVHGERRYRAAKSLGWSTIPAEVRDLTPEEAGWLALVENVQRADLSPIEEARAYQDRLSSGMTQIELGTRIGKTQSYIAQKLRLLSMPAPIILLVDKGALSEGHARQLLKLKGIYPPGVRTEMMDEGKYSIQEQIDALRSDGCYVFSLLNSLRPEDKPLSHMVGLMTEETPEAITEACVSFIEYLYGCELNPEAWTVGAFWWSCFAVHHSISVADLAKVIDSFEQRLTSSLFWWSLRGDKPPETEGMPDFRAKLESMRYFGYYSDLRHAGLAEWIDKNKEEFTTYIYRTMVETKPQAWKRVIDEGFLEPSICQPWSDVSEKYMELKQEEIEYSERWLR